MDKEGFADLLALAATGARCAGGHDGSVYPDDSALLSRFRAWLVESEIMTAQEAERA